MKFKVEKSDQQWREELSPLAFCVTREGGTEPPFSGEYYHHHEPGVYHCVGCKTPLFDSTAKYDSGSGWPSYFQPVDENNLVIRTDHSLDRTRDEVLCATCGSHLGHVFNDGPPPTGLRYCINSAALIFEPSDQ